MSADMVNMQAQLNQIMAKLDRVLGTQAPDLTVSEFAKRANLSRSTVYERIKDKTITLRHGRLAVSELSKVTS
jgi:excisionase family DNA binding protein